MGECLQKACPCLEGLWQRIFKKPAPPGHERGGGGGGGGGGGETSSVGSAVKTPTKQSPAPQPERPPEDCSGSIYTALWPFDSRHADELSFREGDLFTVTECSGDWWTARKIDKNGCVLDTGIVPCNYLARAESLEEQPWYFGTMNRVAAQSHLMGPRNDQGAFLIRHSEKDDVGYVLSGKTRKSRVMEEAQKENERRVG